MAIPTTILNARVKNKIATNDYWLSVEDELGPILAGEMALVYNDEGLAVNFKVGDGTKKYSELPYFIAYFNNVTNCKVIPYIETSGNKTIAGIFRNQSTLAKIYFINNSGAEVTLNLGSTDGGTEVGSIVLPNDISCLDVDAYFDEATTLYLTGLVGVDYTMFILYYQLDEQPVIPSGGSGGVGTQWVAGTVYAFKPMYSGHTAASWDFISGFGKVGTPYENAVLWGTNGLPDLGDTYLRGYKTGDTLGGSYGDNSKTIAFANLPELKVSIPSNIGGVAGSGGIQYNGANNNTVSPSIRDASLNPFAGQTAIDISPKSNIVLYFTGILTT